MCHVSVGHIARILEQAGIPTVIIAVSAFQETLKSMTSPRLLLTPFPMGRPLGLPGDKVQHEKVIQAALSLLQEAQEAGIVREWGESYLG